MSAEDRVRLMHQAWRQLDYDLVQGRPDFWEMVMREFNITKQEAIILLEEMDRYPS
jgi:hypothetical protein